MSLVRNVRTVVSTPGMAAAYARFLAHRMLRTGGPFLPTRRFGKIGHWIRFGEYWTFLSMNSEREFAFMSRFAELHATAIDVGANIGLFSIAMVIAGFGKVHAFEPMSVTLERLSANLRLNGLEGRVHVHKLGLGSEEREAEFVYEGYSPGTSHLASARGDVPHASPEERIKIVTLDAFAKAEGVAEIAFLKIDVEGMELEVLSGARNLLGEHRIKAGLIEICPQNLERYGVSVDQLADVFERHRYSLCFLDADGMPTIAANRNRLRATVLDNVVFVPN